MKLCHHYGSRTQRILRFSFLMILLQLITAGAKARNVIIVQDFYCIGVVNRILLAFDLSCERNTRDSKIEVNSESKLIQDITGDERDIRYQSFNPRSLSEIARLHVTVIDTSTGMILCQDTTDSTGYYQCSGIPANTIIQIVFTSLDGTSSAATKKFNISDTGSHTLSAGTSSEGIVYLDVNGNGQYDIGEEGNHAKKYTPSPVPSPAPTTEAPTNTPTKNPTADMVEGYESPTKSPTTNPAGTPVTVRPSSSLSSHTCQSSSEIRKNLIYNLTSEVSSSAMAQWTSDFAYNSSYIANNAQGSALEWLITYDEFIKCPESEYDIDIFKERYILAIFYFATGGEFSWINCGRSLSDARADEDVCLSGQYDRFLSSQLNHCRWYGITCNSDDRVIGVKLGKCFQLLDSEDHLSICLAN